MVKQAAQCSWQQVWAGAAGPSLAALLQLAASPYAATLPRFLLEGLSVTAWGLLEVQALAAAGFYDRLHECSLPFCVELASAAERHQLQRLLLPSSEQVIKHTLAQVRPLPPAAAR